jgi:hypothetical protein
MPKRTPATAVRCFEPICSVQTRKQQLRGTVIGNGLNIVYKIAVRPDTHPTLGKAALEKTYRRLLVVTTLTFSEFARACEVTLRPMLGSTRVSAGLAALAKVWRQLYVKSAAVIKQWTEAQRKKKSVSTAAAVIAAPGSTQTDAMDLSSSTSKAPTDNAASLSSSSGLDALLLASEALQKVSHIINQCSLIEHNDSTNDVSVLWQFSRCVLCCIHVCAWYLNHCRYSGQNELLEGAIH